MFSIYLRGQATAQHDVHIDWPTNDCVYWSMVISSGCQLSVP